MIKLLAVIAGLFMSGCNYGSDKGETVSVVDHEPEEPIIEESTESEVYPVDVNRPDLTSEDIEDIEKEIATQVQFDGIDAVVNGVTFSGATKSSSGGYAFQYISESKPLGEYVFEVAFVYRYAVWMNIYLDGMCVVGKYWSGKWLFTDLMPFCSDYLNNPPQYSHADLVIMYGDMAVDTGINFDAFFTRESSVVATWRIE